MPTKNRVHIILARVSLDGACTYPIVKDDDVCVCVTRHLLGHLLMEHVHFANIRIVSVRPNDTHGIHLCHFPSHRCHYGTVHSRPPSVPHLCAKRPHHRQMSPALDRIHQPACGIYSSMSPPSFSLTSRTVRPQSPSSVPHLRGIHQLVYPLSPTSPNYNSSRATTSLTYSPMSPTTSPRYSPMSPSLSPMSLQYILPLLDIHPAQLFIRFANHPFLVLSSLQLCHPLRSTKYSPQLLPIASVASVPPAYNSTSPRWPPSSPTHVIQCIIENEDIRGLRHPPFGKQMLALEWVVNTVDG
ncbi:hypothetical protein F5J12DRAFT_446473 [Pisolithus orientalis]|uniref:uncharacterized protein n=1 Tax=Pisolithus orientalis TaxID=936130 RepID=UPI0022248CE7|nr:uncharacterized protein F5J12DRAFT_446473 [Pisolithus orientalis]KAI6025740.1 hypothetical protein F5J12DRAFT_446473 [Pisolithus orientalis]